MKTIFSLSINIFLSFTLFSNLSVGAANDPSPVEWKVVLQGAGGDLDYLTIDMTAYAPHQFNGNQYPNSLILQAWNSRLVPSNGLRMSSLPTEGGSSNVTWSFTDGFTITGRAYSLSDIDQVSSFQIEVDLSTIYTDASGGYLRASVKMGQKSESENGPLRWSHQSPARIFIGSRKNALQFLKTLNASRKILTQMEQAETISVRSVISYLSGPEPMEEREFIDAWMKQSEMKEPVIRAAAKTLKALGLPLTTSFTSWTVPVEFLSKDGEGILDEGHLEVISRGPDGSPASILDLNLFDHSKNVYPFTMGVYTDTASTKSGLWGRNFQAQAEGLFHLPAGDPRTPRRVKYKLAINTEVTRGSRQILEVHQTRVGSEIQFPERKARCQLWLHNLSVDP